MEQSSIIKSYQHKERHQHFHLLFLVINKILPPRICVRFLFFALIQYLIIAFCISIALF